MSEPPPLRGGGVASCGFSICVILERERELKMFIGCVFVKVVVNTIAGKNFFFYQNLDSHG